MNQDLLNIKNPRNHIFTANTAGECRWCEYRVDQHVYGISVKGFVWFVFGTGFLIGNFFGIGSTCIIQHFR